MKNLSDEELVRKYIISHIQCFIRNLPEHHQWSKERDSLKTELLSRLERGRKAIEFVEALIMHRDNGVDLEAEGRIYNWIDEYQQFCKEDEE